MSFHQGDVLKFYRDQGDLLQEVGLSSLLHQACIDAGQSSELTRCIK